jgi:hypothetical protein
VRIKNQKIINPAVDEQFVIPHPTLMQEGGVPVELGLTTARAIRLFLNEAWKAPAPAPTFDDSAMAMELFQSVRHADAGDFDYIEIDDEQHEWLLLSFKQLGASIYRIHAAQILGVLGDLVESEEVTA